MHGRLIDADTLLRDIEHYHVSDGKLQHWVEIQPTVDAVTVVHGRWEKVKNPQWPAYSHDKCNICGWWNTKNALCYDGNHKSGHSLNYCPGCGAKMDGKDDSDGCYGKAD